MARYRRNQLELTAPLPPAKETEWNLSGLTILGMVANPKTLEPALVVTDGEYVSLRALFAEDVLFRIGRGYFEESETAPSQITDLPRSHTPDGVKIRGRGWGTSLYTGLALAAHQEYERVVDIKSSTRGDGICSETETRSREADVWWKKALSLGLADQVEGEPQEEIEEGVDVEVDPADLSRVVDVEGTIRYVNTLNVDIERSVPGLTVEQLTYDSVEGRHLVCAALHLEVPSKLTGEQALAWMWRGILAKPDLIDSSSSEALLALDVRNLHEAAVNLISLCMLKSGLSEAVVDELRLRYDRGLDPGEPSRQTRLFTPNQGGMADVLAARQAVGWDELAELP